METCFLSLVRAFHKNPSIKKGKEKRATSPRIKQFVPKISKIPLKNEKRTDIFCINPIVLICVAPSILIQSETPFKKS